MINFENNPLIQKTVQFSLDIIGYCELLEETHIALNDRTNEGLRHKIHPCFSVQYHPEASPGPEDANYLFDEFIELMEEFKK